MGDGELSCRWRLLCFRREVEVIERDHRVELGQRVADELGSCEVCGLEVVRMKGSGTSTHVVPILPVETRVKRAEAAAAHRPKVRVSA